MNFHVIEGLYYMSPAAAICAIAVALVLEVPRFDGHRFLNALPHKWHLFLANASLGFLVNGAQAATARRHHSAKRPHMHAHRARAQPSRTHGNSL